MRPEGDGLVGTELMVVALKHVGTTAGARELFKTRTVLHQVCRPDLGLGMLILLKDLLLNHCPVGFNT